MQTFKRKAGDTGAVIRTSLLSDGVPYVLTTATVRLIAKRASTGVATSIVGTVVSATNGTVSATVDTLLTQGDLFHLEWEVTDGAATLTFPGDSYDHLVVTADLD